MYNYLRLPQTRSPEPSQPGHAPCIPSLLKLCENTVSFCYYGSTSHTSVNIPRNFIKACSQLIECLGNSAVCSLSSCQRWFENILKLFALLTVLLAAMGIAASPLGVVDVSVFSMPYFRLADSRETIWMRKSFKLNYLKSVYLTFSHIKSRHQLQFIFGISTLALEGSNIWLKGHGGFPQWAQLSFPWRETNHRFTSQQIK